MQQILDIPAGRMPRHIAIIMDGNGRWAVQRGSRRVLGHQAGARQVPLVVKECARLRAAHGGPEYLTLYSFSLENWKRPWDEVSLLMELYVEYLRRERQLMLENNVRFRHIGRIDDLPSRLVEELEISREQTQHNDGLTLALALNYGGRAEITHAARMIAAEVAAGRLKPEQIDEAAVEHRLYTSGMPDVDLLIRTAGEMRVSNYLLWQISYAELHVCPQYWPDFGVAQLHSAIVDYARRNRRFGALDSEGTSKS